VHEALDALLERAKALEDAYTEALHILPKYDVQHYRIEIKGLVGDIAGKREMLAPRKKFQFKRREPQKTAIHEMPSGSEPVTVPPKTDTDVCVLDMGSCCAGEVWDKLQDKTIIRGPGELSGRDVTLQDMQGCRIVLLDRIGALRCQRLRGCEILVGAVSSSALLYACQQCVVTVASKQLRLHDSEEILLHLHTLSGPVIEHSRRILVAPFDLTYPAITEHWSAASLGTPLTDGSAEANAVWAQVQDFNWHKRQASPNWSVLPAGIRRMHITVETIPTEGEMGSLPPPLEYLKTCGDCWDLADQPDEF